MQIRAPGYRKELGYILGITIFALGACMHAYNSQLLKVITEVIKVERF